MEKGNGLRHVLKGTVGYARRERWRGSKMIQLEADNLGGILPKIAYTLCYQEVSLASPSSVIGSISNDDLGLTRIQPVALNAFRI